MSKPKTFFQIQNIAFDLYPLSKALSKSNQHRSLNDQVDAWQRLEAQIMRWKYVKEVDFGHLNYALCDFESARFDVVHRRATKMAARFDKLRKGMENKS